MKDCGLGLVERAEKLAERLEQTAARSCEGCKASCSYPQALACIRHNCTNYEELLGEISHYLCVEIYPTGKCTYEPEEHDQCPLKEEAHDILKLAANDLARAIYRD